MARHEFGIMQNAPKQGKRYDEYEPQQYSCISVDDDFIHAIDANLHSIDCYWHTLDVKGKGLAYCGITMIPPDALGFFIEIVKGIPPLSELRQLLENALKENIWIIHFGL